MKKINPRNQFIFLLLLLIIVCSCSSDDDNTTPQKQTFVYVAATTINSNQNLVAKYWKNNEEVTLTDGTKDASAKDVVVSGNDVYVAGSEKNNFNKFIAKYWKNGVAVSLTNGNYDAKAEHIEVVGNDVYVLGYEVINGKLKFRVWKNGVILHHLESNDFYGYQINQFKIVGNDVYALGYYYNPANQAQVITYWKNGSIFNVTELSSRAIGYDIEVIGTDVYIAGMELNFNSIHVAKYWKNNVEVVLSDGSKSTYATDIRVVNNEVTTLGYEKSGNNIKNILWNGNIPSTLQAQSNKFAYKMQTIGNDLYVLLESDSGNSTSIEYLKNQEKITLVGSINIQWLGDFFVIEK